MAFFRTINFSEPLAAIPGEGVTLRPPQMTDYGEWAALREASRDFLIPWEPTWPVDDLTRSAFRRRVRRYVEDLQTGVVLEGYMREDLCSNGIWQDHLLLTRLQEPAKG